MQERLDPLSEEARRRDREILAAAALRRSTDAASRPAEVIRPGESKRAARIRMAADAEASSVAEAVESQSTFEPADVATLEPDDMDEQEAAAWREIHKINQLRHQTEARARNLRRQRREIEANTERIRAETREIDARTERIRRDERMWDDFTGSEKAVRIIFGIGVVPPVILFIVGVVAFLAAMATQINALGGVAGWCVGIAGTWLLFVGGICFPLAGLVHIVTKDT